MILQSDRTPRPNRVSTLAPLTNAIATQLQQLYGRGDAMDWAAVESHLERMAAEARNGARAARARPVARTDHR